MKIIKKYNAADPSLAQDYFCLHGRLSLPLVQQVFQVGGVWRRPQGKGKLLRCRSPHTTLTANDHLEFYYDAQLLQRMLQPPPHLPRPLWEQTDWGAWYKPTGILSQGTTFGDQNSVLRIVELQKKKDVYLVHRLDRESAGIMLLAYTPRGAAALSKLLAERKIQKLYQLQVSRPFPYPQDAQKIALPIEGQEALTSYLPVSATEVLAQIHTGRHHQIRRHFAQIGHPLLGDPLYGKGNKNRDGLKLMASRLQFRDPFSGQEIDLEIPTTERLFAANDFID